MRIEEYASLDGRALASLMGSRQVSFAEVTEAALAACDAINPVLNAVIERYDDVHDEARLKDGPFRGVPYLTKDVGRHFRGRLAE